MLVLSRRPSEEILFPDLNITVQVVSVKSGAVRLGITAPSDVTILRAEVPDRAAEWGRAEPPANGAAHPVEQIVGRRLEVARLGLAELRRQLASGRLRTADQLLDKIEEDLALLQQRLHEPEHPEAPPPSRRHRKALLVDDDRNTCELLAEWLRLAGLEVDTAGDGVAALDYLQTHEKPDVLLLDMVLPRCDGPTTLRAIRRNPDYAGLKIFGLSGHPRDEFDLGSGSESINGWYQKPIDPRTLLQDLDRELSLTTNRL